MALPEDGQNIRIGNDSGIVIHLERFGVIAKAVIGWVDLFATCIASAGPYDSRETPKLGVGSPESTKREGGCLNVWWLSCVNGRYS